MNVVGCAVGAPVGGCCSSSGSSRARPSGLLPRPQHCRRQQRGGRRRSRQWGSRVHRQHTWLRRCSCLQQVQLVWGLPPEWLRGRQPGHSSSSGGCLRQWRRRWQQQQRDRAPDAAAGAGAVDAAAKGGVCKVSHPPDPPADMADVGRGSQGHASRGHASRTYKRLPLPTCAVRAWLTPASLVVAASLWVRPSVRLSVGLSVLVCFRTYRHAGQFSWRVDVGAIRQLYDDVAAAGSRDSRILRSPAHSFAGYEVRAVWEVLGGLGRTMPGCRSVCQRLWFLLPLIHMVLLDSHGVLGLECYGCARGTQHCDQLVYAVAVYCCLLLCLPAVGAATGGDTDARCHRVGAGLKPVQLARLWPGVSSGKDPNCSQLCCCVTRSATVHLNERGWHCHAAAVAALLTVQV